MRTLQIELDHVGPSRRNFLWSSAAVLASVPLASLLPPVAASAAPAKDELAVLRGMAPRVIQAWSGGVFPNDDGATDHNRSGYLQVGFQYHTFNLLSAALLNNDLRSLDAAIRVAEYAMAHQRPDGSFEYNPGEGEKSNPEARPSTVTLFFYDFGHSLLLLAKSTWFTSSAACAPHRARVAALRPKLATSLDWLMTQRTLLETDRAASNRTLGQGLAFYLMGRALSHPDAISAGRQIVISALDDILPDGTFREGRGFDSSYQAINILECAWLYFYVDPADDALSDRLWAAVQKGYAREADSIQDSGEISTVGNSRVSTKGEAYLGHVKSVNWKQVGLAIAYYGGMANDSTARMQSANIMSFYFPPKA